MALLMAERHHPTAVVKAQILVGQNNACNVCGSAFQEDMEWDHIIPLHSSCAGNEQVFQALLFRLPRREDSAAG